MKLEYHSIRKAQQVSAIAELRLVSSDASIMLDLSSGDLANLLVSLADFMVDKCQMNYDTRLPLEAVIKAIGEDDYL